MSQKKPVILDVDPGHDDAIAMLLAGKADELDLRGITVVAGNQVLEKTLQNALNVCNYAGLTDVPVYKGMGRPLVREQIIAADIHGDTGLDGPEFPETEMKAEKEHAVDFIIDEVLNTPEGITLIPTGPLTNIALALRREPKIKDNIDRIVLMGGSTGRGNVTPVAEFNIYVDAEAARIVFESGLPVTMVGLNLTHQARATEKRIEPIRELGSKTGAMVVDLLEFFGQTYQKIFNIEAPPIHDVCAVAGVIDPDVFTTKKMRVDIETDSDLTYGQTVCDYHGVTGREPNTEVAMELNRELFWELLLSVLKKYN